MTDPFALPEKVNGVATDLHRLHELYESFGLKVQLAAVGDGHDGYVTLTLDGSEQSADKGGGNYGYLAEFTFNPDGSFQRVWVGC